MGWLGLADPSHTLVACVGGFQLFRSVDDVAINNSINHVHARGVGDCYSQQHENHTRQKRRSLHHMSSHKHGTRGIDEVTLTRMPRCYATDIVHVAQPWHYTCQAYEVNLRSTSLSSIIKCNGHQNHE